MLPHSPARAGAALPVPAFPGENRNKEHLKEGYRIVKCFSMKNLDLLVSGAAGDASTSITSPLRQFYSYF